MKLSTSITTAALGLLISLGGIAAASAATPVGVQQPRRVEVTHRITHQELRITQKLRHDRISMIRAERLRAREAAIRAEERRMARRDHGHLTRVQVQRLNHQENAVAHKL